VTVVPDADVMVTGNRSACGVPAGEAVPPQAAIMTANPMQASFALAQG
jgi:hypothetical protein